MSKIICCPYCFKEFKDKEAMLQCENEKINVDTGEKECPEEPNAKLSRYRQKADLYAKHVFRQQRTFFGQNKYNEGHKCDKCGVLSMKYVCPHCNNEIPKKMLETGTEIVSIIGGPASGKSTYIVSLMQQMEKYGYRVQLHINPQDVGRGEEKTSIMNSNARNELFNNRNRLKKTAVGKLPIPWMFSLESSSTKKIVYLVFYDTAGEDFGGAERMRNLNYLRMSKGVIVLLDTLSIPFIQRIIKSDKDYSGDKATPFEETVIALKNFAESNNELYNKPFAFAFSKIDVLQEHCEDLQFSIENFSRENDSSFKHTGFFSLKDIDAADQALKEYLEAPEYWDNGNLVADMDHLWGKNCKFFGVSSLGGPLSKDKDIKPFRVMDPLIWILYKLGGFGIPTDK